MTLQRPRAAQPAAVPVLLGAGFRPFFLLAGFVGAAAILTWLLVLRGVVTMTGAGLTPVDLHVHEMVFGFVAAVIAGFLLTAVRNWTGIAPLQPRGLKALVALFLAGRAAVLLEAFGGVRGIGLVEAAFLPVLAITVARPILKTKNHRNLGVAAVLVALAVVDVALHAAALAHLPQLAASARAAALLLPCVLCAVVGGRVIPLFTHNATVGVGAVVRARGRIDDAALVLAALVVLAAAAAPFSAAVRAVEPYIDVAAGVTMLWRMRGWASRATLRVPLLWILHLGFACLGAGFVARGVALIAPDVVPLSAALHLLALGAVASLCVGMMTRVSLGHTGRLLTPSSTGVAAFVALQAALILRVAAAYVSGAARAPMLDAAGGAFVLACVLFLAGSARVLVTPRPDGKPG